MPDLYGATELPVQVPGAGETVGDPALDTLAAFIAAVLQFECWDAWEAVAKGEPLVRAAHTHNPRERDLSANLLPGLFLFRSQVDPQSFTDADIGSESVITCLWVFPPTKDAVAATRLPIIAALERALHRAIGPRNGRHPAWVASGDTDPYAARYGSSILTHGGLMTATLGQFQHAAVEVQETTFEAVQFELRIREDYVPGDTLSGSQYIIVRRDAATPTAPVPFDQEIDTATP